MANRYADAIFCDDIRSELGNKTSLMGVYGSKMFVPAFPFVMPKLCVRVVVGTDLDDDIESLELRVMPPEGETIEIKPSTQDLERLQQTLEGKGIKKAFIAQFSASPFNVTKPGKMRVFAKLNGQELFAGSIEFLLREGPAEGAAMADVAEATGA